MAIAVEVRTFHHDPETDNHYHVGVLGHYVHIKADGWDAGMSIPREVLQHAANDPRNGWRIDLRDRSWGWEFARSMIKICADGVLECWLPETVWRKAIALA